ncbi:MAG TPA: hypothetical protein VHL55_06730, partial [Acidimicrobiia bacterium]|nr:hypothetical protein [Acidimicrobiia bacterium]
PPAGRAALFPDDPGRGTEIGLGVALAEELFRRLTGAEWGADEYRTRCLTLGRAIRWSGGQSGVARDIDSVDGSLLVDLEGGGVVRLNAGEVRHVVSRGPQ